MGRCGLWIREEDGFFLVYSYFQIGPPKKGHIGRNINSSFLSFVERFSTLQCPLYIERSIIILCPYLRGSTIYCKQTKLSYFFFYRPVLKMETGTWTEGGCGLLRTDFLPVRPSDKVWRERGSRPPCLAEASKMPLILSVV